MAEPEYDSGIAWAAYEGVARELVHLMKYDAVMPAAAYLTRRLSELELPEVDAIVPVPLARRRRRERGFNQAQALATGLFKLISAPCVTGVLVRRRETLSQAGLTWEAREKNVRGAFAVRRPERVEGRRVLLVDDVLTTGATARACARALKQAGAREVHVVTAARADLVNLTSMAARRITAGQEPEFAEIKGAVDCPIS